MAVFHQVLVTNITSKLGEYKGVTFTIGRPNRTATTPRSIPSVNRPNNPPTNVQWVISNPASDPEDRRRGRRGNLSAADPAQRLRLLLAHNNNNIDALITAMQQQVAQNHASG